MDVLRGVACLLLGYASFSAFLVLERRLRSGHGEDTDASAMLARSEISAGSPDPLEPNPLLAVQGLTFFASMASTSPASCLTMLLGAGFLGACAAGAYTLDAGVGLFCFWLALVSIFPIGFAYSYLLWRRAGTGK